MYAEYDHRSPSAEASAAVQTLQQSPLKKPGRGRRRDDSLPYNRARDVQRAFRARRAAHLDELEHRVLELEEENAELRDALALPPAGRAALGQGPTGKGKPLVATSRATTHSSSGSDPAYDEDHDLDEDLELQDGSPPVMASTSSTTANTHKSSLTPPSPLIGTETSVAWIAQQVMRDREPLQTTGLEVALESMPPNSGSYSPNTIRNGMAVQPPYSQHPVPLSRPAVPASAPQSFASSPISTLSRHPSIPTQSNLISSPSPVNSNPRDPARSYSRAGAGSSDACLFAVPPAHHTDVTPNNYALPRQEYGSQASYQHLIKREAEEAVWPGSHTQSQASATAPDAYTQPRGGQSSPNWDRRVEAYPLQGGHVYASTSGYGPQSSMVATQSTTLSGWQSSHPLHYHPAESSSHHHPQQQSQYYAPRAP